VMLELAEMFAWVVDRTAILSSSGHFNAYA
jgi:hypothetical protein